MIATHFEGHLTRLIVGMSPSPREETGGEESSAIHSADLVTNVNSIQAKVRLFLSIVFAAG